MPAYRVGGITVQFPFDAYDCQLVYMERVIQSLQQGRNALLESPTGTGKTLCLLCATLAWRESLVATAAIVASQPHPQSQERPLLSTFQQDVAKLPMIIYTSRTHSQLQQVIGELRASVYRPKMVVLGSREQMCINPDVRRLRGRTQNHACRSLVKSRSCDHYNRVADYLKVHPELGNEPIDIEDLVTIGKAHGPCPYYLSRELHNSAELLFSPYNYLIDKENRRSLTGISWDRTVIIFDEAHNLEGICADASSFDLPAAHLSACIAEARQCVDLVLARRATDNAADTSLDPDNFAVLQALLLELEKKINDMEIVSHEFGLTKPGPFIYNFLEDIKITWETVTMLIDTIDQAIDLLQDEATSKSARSPNSSFRLQGLRDAFRLIFRGTDSSHANCYRVHIHEARSREGDRGPKGAKNARILSWWCFNPGIAMEELRKMGVRSVILTSGTLSPMDSFAMELNLPFDIRLENPHVIGPSQIWVGVLSIGPYGKPLNSSYRSRDSPEYKLELGNTIDITMPFANLSLFCPVNIARIVPDGVLVFFPSYYLLNSCIESWQSQGPLSAGSSSTVWERICKHKQPVIEPREAEVFNQAMEDFSNKLKANFSTGAIFFAVCRGKVSEGLDFADRAGRAVVVTGIPYAMKTDPKVRLKREYLDEQARAQTSKTKQILRGEDWYVQQAARAVNQAVGRVIRHRNDYGAIILCDERFSQGSTQSQMSLWLRPHVRCYTRFGDASYSLTRFFRDRDATADILLPPKHLPQHPKTVQLEVNTATKTSSVSFPAVILRGSTGNIDFRNDEKVGSSFEVLGRRTTTVSGQLGAQNGESKATTSRPSLSSMLAANRQKAESQLLSSLAVTPAHRAIGGTSGSVSAVDTRNELKSSAQAFQAKKGTSRLGTSALVDKPWGLERHAINLANNGSQQAEASAHSKVPLSTGALGSPSRQGDKASSPPAVVKKASSRTGDEREKNASEFLKEVKARLTPLEFKSFLTCMKNLKSQTVNMEKVIDTVANMFSAPERLFLLQRFGEFVPQLHRGLYQERLAAKEAEVRKLTGGLADLTSDKRGVKRPSKFALAALPLGSRKTSTQKHAKEG